MTEREPHTRSRHWPRDAPIRWGAFVRGLSYRLVAVVAVAAHLVLGVISIAAILGGTVGPIGQWIVAVGWGALALWGMWSWWFWRRGVVIAPLAAAALLGLAIWTRA